MKIENHDKCSYHEIWNYINPEFVTIPIMNKVFRIVTQIIASIFLAGALAFFLPAIPSLPRVESFDISNTKVVLAWFAIFALVFFLFFRTKRKLILLIFPILILDVFTMNH